MQRSNLFQLVVMVVSLVALVVLIFMAWTHVVQEEAATFDAGMVSLEEAHFKVVNLMGSILVDLDLLSDSWELERYLENENSIARDVLQTRWIEFSDSRILYDQIRFIDGAGMELIRVNQSAKGSFAVSDDKLQDKSSRYYFKDSLVLEKGEVFVSALDLNKEQGQVEDPYKPMLRIGLPVFDTAGVKRGIILVNVLAQEILDLVQREVNRPAYGAMMLNVDGFWLLAPDQGDTWSFMFDGAWSFPAKYPKVWEHINQNPKGYIQNLRGLFLYETVHPIADLVENVPGLKMAAGQDDYHWILVAHSTVETLDSHRQILILERLPWMALPLVLLLQSGITFFRRRPISQGTTSL